MHRLDLGLHSHPKEFFGMEFEPLLTPREKSPLPEIFPEEDQTRDAVDSEPKHYQRAIPAPNCVQRHNSRFLQSLHCATNCLQQVRSSGQGEIMCKSWTAHQTFITCNMSCVVWCEGTSQLLSLTEYNLHLF